MDLAFLGLAQVDRRGNVNVSKFGARLAGAGGFINISQNAGKVVFMGTFNAGGVMVATNGDCLCISREGSQPKFVRQVEQVTFSGQRAASLGRQVIYVTERCVFKLTTQGLLLTEVAPGLDLEEHILSKMEFAPLVAPDLRRMAPALFMD